MGKLALTALIYTALMAPVGAIAQSGQSGDGELVAPELSKPTPGHLLNQDYLTPTGETVPRPGVSQSSARRPRIACCSSRTTTSTRASAAIADATLHPQRHCFAFGLRGGTCA